MELILRGRQEGKTTRLIEIAAEEDRYIVCRAHSDAWRIAQEAKELGHDIHFPLTYDEFLNGSFSRKNIQGLLIDDVGLLLNRLARGCGVRAITLDAPPTQNTEEGE